MLQLLHSKMLLNYYLLFLLLKFVTWIFISWMVINLITQSAIRFHSKLLSKWANGWDIFDSSLTFPYVIRSTKFLESSTALRFHKQIWPDVVWYSHLGAHIFCICWQWAAVMSWILPEPERCVLSGKHPLLLFEFESRFSLQPRLIELAQAPASLFLL